MTQPALHELDAAELLACYHTGELSPRTVVERSLERIALFNPVINSVVLTLAERARAAAAESERRWAEGRARPLEGIPFGVKDVMDVTGTATTGGSALYVNHTADDDAEVVRRTRQAGGVLIAKEGTTEFAIGGPHNPTFGAVHNPWDLRRWSGGSSTGPAASLAARLYPLSIGSDAGGSIRMPASWCGVTGLKPTSGAVPRTGVLPLSWTTETVGPMGRSAVDVARLFGVLRGYDPRDPRSVAAPADSLADLAAGVVPETLAGLRIGVPSQFFFDLCDDDVRAGFDHVISTLVEAGASVVEVSLPSAPDAMALGYHVLFTEAASVHAGNGDRLDRCDPVMVRRLSQGVLTPAVDYLRALQFRGQLQREFATAFTGADLIAVPSTPCTAPTLDDLRVQINGESLSLYEAQSQAGMLCNLAGVPGLAFPSGFDRSGCPTSAQLIAPPHGEAVALRAAAVFQARTNHHRKVPPAVAGEVPVGS